MITKKALLKRIESFEDFMGVVYSVDMHGYGQHHNYKYGLMNDLEKLREKNKKE